MSQKLHRMMLPFVVLAMISVLFCFTIESAEAVIKGVRVSLSATTLSVAARGTVGLTAIIQDKDGNRVSDATDEVVFTTDPVGAGDFTPGARIPARAGRVSATFRPKLAGRVTVIAGAEGMESGSVVITVRPGSAAQLSVSSLLPIITADGRSRMEVSAQLKDIDGNLATGDNTTRVIFSVSGPGEFVRIGVDTVVVSADTVTARAGVAVATLRSKTEAGVITVSAEAVVAGQTLSGSRSIRAIGSSRATDFTLDIFPTRITTNDPLAQVSVTLRDNNRNVSEKAAGRVRLRVSGTGGGTLQDTLLTVILGRARTQYIPAKAGSDTIRAEVSGIGEKRGVITVLPGAARKIQLTAPRSTLTANGRDLVVVTATVTDARGNAVTDTMTVSFTAVGTGTVSPASRRTSFGRATANVTAGTQVGEIRVTARAAGLDPATLIIATVPGPPNKVVLTASADSILADGVETVTLTASVQDANGNVITSDSTSVVTFAVTSGAGMVASDSVKVVQGVATTTLTATDEGSITITATSGTLSGGTATVIGKPKPAVRIKVEASPASLPADGRSMAVITASIVDAKDNVATTDNRTVVTFAVTGAGSIDSTSVKVTAGVATTQLTAGVLDSPPGEVMVTATAPEAAKLEAGSVTVTLTRPLLDRIVLTASAVQQDASGNWTATLTATVFDTTGAPATGDTSTTVSFVTLAGPATVSPASATAVNGQATATLTFDAGTTSGRALVTASATGLIQGWVVVRIPEVGLVRAKDDIPPGPAKDIKADTTMNAGKITVTWTLSDDDRIIGRFPFGGFVVPIRGVERYDIYRRDVSGSGWSLIGKANPGASWFVDPTASPGTTYAYVVVAADMDNETLPVFRVGGQAHNARIARLVLTAPGLKMVVARPTLFSLSQNRPNPFNPETTIDYSLPETVPVRLQVYNAIGQLVRVLVDDVQPAGYHTAVWNGRDERGRSLSSGVYFYRLTAGSFSEVKGMLLVK
jgi:hypothetical protein